ncbi:hypothetical protein OC834_005142 [Tilletia horrida]|nr:hypothetical protein OC834_005142 [Tilletia horrida]
MQQRNPRRAAAALLWPAAALLTIALVLGLLLAAPPIHGDILDPTPQLRDAIALLKNNAHALLKETLRRARAPQPCYLDDVGRRKDCAWLAEHKPWLPRNDDQIRPLPWGQLNFLHTTDGHGWLAGHQSSSPPEPQYSADLASWASFSTHMKAKARREQVDLLLVDSGDLYDGNGLSDGFPHTPPGQPGHERAVQGHVAGKLISLIEYDLLTIGNHELYNYSVARDVHLNFAPRWNGRYLTSNSYIHINDTSSDSNTTERKPIGSLFSRFRTPVYGFHVTAFGVLFNFQGAGAGIEVQDPEQMVREPWFQKALDPAKPVDVFVVAAHMPVRGDPGLDAVHHAIRRVHNDTPIVFLGGHTHVRDCRMLDDRTLAVESGRYFETFGFASVSGFRRVGVVGERALKFARRYIDANVRNFAFHAGLSSAKELVTDKELFIRRVMQMISRAWGLDTLHGVVPTDYFLDRFPKGHAQSLLSLLADHVLPTVVRPSEPSRTNVSSLILINSFSQRHDVLVGPFTTNEQYIVSPYRDRFKYIKDVPWEHAKVLLERLNRQRHPTLKDSWRNEDRRYGWGFIDDIFDAWQGSQWAMFSRQRRAANRTQLSSEPSEAKPSPEEGQTAEQEQQPRQQAASNYAPSDEFFGPNSTLVEVADDGVEPASEPDPAVVTDLPPGTTKAVLDAVALSKLPSLGYKTADLCEGEGDDTEHTPITFSSDQPTYVASFPEPLPQSDADVVDVVFVEFIRDPILRILNELSGDEGRRYYASHVQLWGNVTTQLLYPLYARARWQHDNPEEQIVRLEHEAEAAGFQRWPGEPFDAHVSG